MDIVKQLNAERIRVIALFITGHPLWVNLYINKADVFAVLRLPGSRGQCEIGF